jgi:hypothetical protein
VELCRERLRLNWIHGPLSTTEIERIRPRDFRFRHNFMHCSLSRRPNRSPQWLFFAIIPALLPGFRGFAQTGQPPGFDATAVVRRSVANRFAADASHQPLRFALHKQDEHHNVTQEIVETPQGDVALLVAVNGGALSAVGREAERNRLDLLDQHPENQEHRRKREAADSARVDELLKLLPDAFLYRYVSTIPCSVTVPPEVPIPGVAAAAAPAAQVPASDCYHMTFKPNPHFDPPNIEAKILRGMAGEIWIEKSNERLFRLTARLIDDVDFGWGIVGRLDKGGTVYLEQTEIGNKDWELTRMKLSLTGKALMVKPLSFRINEELGNFGSVPPGTDYHKAIQMLESAQPGGK